MFCPVKGCNAFIFPLWNGKKFYVYYGMHDTECFHTHSKNARPAPSCSFGCPQICMKALFCENHKQPTGVIALFTVAAKFNENFIHELSVVAENTIEIDSCKYSKLKDCGDVTFYRCVNSSHYSIRILCIAGAASKNVDGRIVGLASPYGGHTCNLRYRRKIPRIALNSEVSILPPGNDFVASDQLPSTSTDFVQRLTSTSTDFVESDQRQIPQISLTSEVSILPSGNVQRPNTSSDFVESDQRPSTSTDFVQSDQRPTSTSSGNVNPFYHLSIEDDTIKRIIATLKEMIERKDEMVCISIENLRYICNRDDAPLDNLISYGFVQICVDLWNTFGG